MKNNILVSLILLLFFTNNVFSQILEPISWKFSIDSSEFETSGALSLTFTPTTELGWYIYSSDNDPNSGPRTEFEFYPNKTYTILGEIIPLNVKTKFDEVWEANVRYLDNKDLLPKKLIYLTITLQLVGTYHIRSVPKLRKCVFLLKKILFFLILILEIT